MSETLTIRIDSELKRQLKEAARRSDRSVTDFVARAVRRAIAAQCLSCGGEHAAENCERGRT